MLRHKVVLSISTAHATARGIVPKLRGGIVILQPLYFLLNFLGDGQNCYSCDSGIVTRFHGYRLCFLQRRVQRFYYIICFGIYTAGSQKLRTPGLMF